MDDLERVTVTLPQDVVREMDRSGVNRSDFVRNAIRHELARRRREALALSLANPHPESLELEPLGLRAWADQLPHDDVAEMVDLSQGRPIQWVPGVGWVEGDR